ncbi:DciA family protein [Streptomyces syringium]|uniref:DciA family protein n=1 Tax=Streptomyces syringium TaxID=76729 RepID=UPI0036CF98E2
MSGGETPGVDLARVALRAAREAARKNGGGQKARSRPRPVRTVRRDGREPLGLGAAIGMMMTERGMVAPAAGGSVLAQFADILAAAAPELAGHVQAVGFDADTGRLDVAPDAPAYGTKLRWIAPKLIAAANERVQGANVRAVHVRAPATAKAGSATAAATPTPQPTMPTVPVERRAPPEGYRRSIEAHRQAARPSLADPAIAEAVERQTAAMRELSRRAFPEPDVVADDAPAPIEQARAQRRRQAAATEAAALRRAREEKAGRRTEPQRLGQTA